MSFQGLLWFFKWKIIFFIRCFAAFLYSFLGNRQIPLRELAVVIECRKLRNKGAIVIVVVVF